MISMKKILLSDCYILKDTGEPVYAAWVTVGKSRCRLHRNLATKEDLNYKLVYPKLVKVTTLTPTRLLCLLGETTALLGEGHPYVRAVDKMIQKITKE